MLSGNYSLILDGIACCLKIYLICTLAFKQYSTCYNNWQPNYFIEFYVTIYDTYNTVQKLVHPLLTVCLF